MGKTNLNSQELVIQEEISDEIKNNMWYKAIDIYLRSICSNLNLNCCRKYRQRLFRALFDYKLRIPFRDSHVVFMIHFYYEIKCELIATNEIVLFKMEYSFLKNDKKEIDGVLLHIYSQLVSEMFNISAFGHDFYDFDKILSGRASLSISPENINYNKSIYDLYAKALEEETKPFREKSNERWGK